MKKILAVAVLALFLASTVAVAQEETLELLHCQSANTKLSNRIIELEAQIRGAQHTRNKETIKILDGKIAAAEKEAKEAEEEKEAKEVAAEKEAKEAEEEKTE